MRSTKQERARRIKHIIELLKELNTMEIEENQAEITTDSTPEDDNEDALLEMRIDFSDKYLPSDKEETKRRIQADTALSAMLAAYERAAFRDGYKAAEKQHKEQKEQAEYNKMFNEVNNDLDYNLDDIHYELAQICAVMQYVKDASADICPSTVEIDNIDCSLRLVLESLKRTHNRLEILTGFASPNKC